MLDDPKLQARPDAEDAPDPPARLIVVSNRLPLRLETDATGAHWRPSAGGLVSALTPVLHRRGGVWIGWAGDTNDVDVPDSYEGIALRSVPISADEYDDFYAGFANQTLWPLYHDAVRAPRFERSWWQAYVSVNRRYAGAAADAAAPGATVWVHDYHLQLVPMMLRALRPDVRIGFFLHIPFPPPELFMQIPWRRELIDGLLGADLVGFQVPGAATNFARLARRLSGATGTGDTLRHEGRTIRVGAFPISIDSNEIILRANDPAVIARAKEIRTDLGDPEFVMLGVDRLDYTKGIQQRVRAVGELFAEGVLTAPRHVMIQIAVPSRGEDAHYEREREEVERLVGEVNGEYGQVGRAAIHYLHQSVEADELVALYLAADVMLVTPLRDGMNLVAKEYVASRLAPSGALVLSEFAGAARELRAAFLVNPHDLDSIKEAIRKVIDVDPVEARARMRRLRHVVCRKDVHAWARDFLAALQQPVEMNLPERAASSHPAYGHAPAFETVA
jgi:alpha,alpha-trehalose-phosphate synthase [UDP-forming]